MPEPITTSELLLQRIANRLDAIDMKLGREPSPETSQTLPPVPAKKRAGKKPGTPVDGL